MPTKFLEKSKRRKIACDVLEYKSKSYLVVVDFFSKWIELIKLKGKTAKDINIELLRIFSSFGYPHIIIADNMPMGSFQCKQFAKENDIQIITSSPNYSQSNGMAEKAVHICKNILRKADSEEEILKALLAYRTTPTKNMTYTPSELLQNRNLRTDIPMHNKKFQPKLCEDVEKQHELKQKIYKTYYDKTAKQRTLNLHPNQKVMFLNNNKWILGSVVKQHSAPRSYVLQSDGREYRRNTKHIKIYNENADESKINKETNDCHSYRKFTRSGRSY